MQVKTNTGLSDVVDGDVFNMMWRHAIGHITYDNVGGIDDLPWANEVEKWIGDRLHNRNYKHNSKKHGKDVLKYSTVLSEWVEDAEVKALTELRNSKWVNSFTVNLWTGKNILIGDRYCIVALTKDKRIGYILKAGISQEATTKLKEFYDRVVDRKNGKGQSSKYSLPFGLLESNTVKVEYVNKEAVQIHFTNAKGSNGVIRDMLLNSNRTMLHLNQKQW